MNCDEFRAAILELGDSDQVKNHERTCASCRAMAPDLRAAAESLGDPAVWEEPSPELAPQVEDLISNASRGRAPELPRPHRIWRALAVAATVVVVAATGLLLTRQSPPDWEVALPATELAVGATANVQGWNEDAGTRMVVAVTGLDPAPAGFIYEFWLSDGPIHVSAGTFSGSGNVELWSGVTRSDFPRLWVTLEPLDEDESPSGNTVLDTAGLEA